MGKLARWSEKTIVYQIYPRSFKDTNDDGVGDLSGVIEKLDYLSELGIDAIWLSPVYPSPMEDFGYDISDYKDINPLFGTLNDFKKLIEEAHKRDIKVMMDYVPNHTSSQHPFFIESKSSRDNPKRDWYIWRDPKYDGSPPNNWISVFGGSAWEYDEKTMQYYLHTFTAGQPDLNWRNKEVVDEMLDVLRFWLALGVDGLRVDAIYFLFKDETFLDEPHNPTYQIGLHEPYDQLLHPHTFARPEVLEMVKRFVHVLEEYDNKFMVTEAYVSIKELLAMYQFISKEWFAPFNFSFMMLPWKAAIHKQFVDEYDTAIGQLYIPIYVMGNHDKHRIATRVGKDQARIAAILLLTLRCMPFLYYGDEIGMENVKIPQEKIQDPWEKNMPGLQLGRDPARTPMQWDETENAGFSNHEPWLPVSKNYETINVEQQRNDPVSIFSLYKLLIKLRKKSQALSYGKYASVDVQNGDVYAYTRTFGHEHLLIILNISNEEQSIVSSYQQGTVLCHSLLNVTPGTIVSIDSLILQPNEGYIFSIT